MSFVSQNQTQRPELDNLAVKRQLEADAAMSQNATNAAWLRFREKSYAVKNRRLYNLSMILSVIFQIISVAVSIVFGAQLILSMSNEIPTVSAYTLSTLLLCLLEFGKRIFIDEAAESYFVFNEIGVSAAIVLILCGLSGVASVGGSFELAKEKTASAILVNKTDESTATADIDKEIQDAKGRLKTIKDENNWQGKLTPAGIKLTKQVENRIDKLVQQKEAKLNRVFSQNDNLDSQAESKGTSSGYAAGIFALLIELICIAAIAYPVYYHLKVKGEIADFKAQNNAGFQSPARGNPSPTSEISTPIGFKDIEISAQKNEISNNATEISKPQSRMEKDIAFSNLYQEKRKVTIYPENRTPFTKVFDTEKEANEYKKHFAMPVIVDRVETQTPPPPPIKPPHVDAPVVPPLDYFTWKGIRDKSAMMRHRRKEGKVTADTYTQNMQMVREAEKAFTGQTELF